MRSRTADGGLVSSHFAEHSSTSLAVPSVLSLFLFILIGCSLFEWCFAFVHRFLLHAHYPYTTPLFDPTDRFADWTSLLPRAKHFGQPGLLLRDDFGPRFSYPLPCVYIYVFFVRVFPHPIRSYLIFSFLTFFSATLYLSCSLSRLGASRIFQFTCWLTLLLGSPGLMLFDRGNIEVFLWLPLVIGMLAFIKDWKYLAALCFALAACLKLYPAIFFLLFIPRRQYKAALSGVLATILLTVASLAGVGPTIGQAFRDMSENARSLRDNQVVSSAERYLRWDHSLFAAEKQIMYRFQLATHRVTSEHPPQFPGALSVYTAVVPATFLLLYALRLRRLPLLNQFIALTVCSVLLPFISYEYTLIHLYFIWAAFLVFLQQDVVSGLVPISTIRLRLITFCFGLIIAPLTALAFEKFAAQVKCGALIVLLVCALCWPMPSTIFRDRLPAPLLDGAAPSDISFVPQEEPV